MYSAAIHKDRGNSRRAREGVKRETERLRGWRQTGMIKSEFGFGPVECEVPIS